MQTLTPCPLRCVQSVTSVSFCADLYSSFDSLTGCDAALLSEYELFLENHCFDVSDSNYGDYSYKFTFPNVMVYDGLNCRAKKPQTQALPTTCQEANAGNDDGGYYSTTADAEMGSEADPSVAEDAKTSRVQRLVAQLRARMLAAAEAGDATAEDTQDPAPQQYYDYEQTTNDIYEQWSLVHSKVAANGPSARPTTSPTVAPTSTPAPSAVPTVAPTANPTTVPTCTPTVENMPTEYPTAQPTMQPTDTASPTERPSAQPTQSTAPTLAPTKQETLPAVDQVVTIAVTQVNAQLASVTCAGQQRGI
jgi:hypothetical protein